MADRTYSMEYIREVVDVYGEAEAVAYHFDPENIEDERLRAAWKRAKDALREIEEILIEDIA